VLSHPACLVAVSEHAERLVDSNGIQKMNQHHIRSVAPIAEVHDLLESEQAEETFNQLKHQLTQSLQQREFEIFLNAIQQGARGLYQYVTYDDVIRSSLVDDPMYDGTAGFGSYEDDDVYY
jgi:hypothetical protein